MKTLKESLFDKDLIKRKAPTFGDLYKPIEVMTPSTNDIKAIGNMFIMSKLKKDSTPLDLNGVYGYDQFKKLYDYLPYVLGKIAELPYEEEFMNTKSDGNYLSYKWKLDDMMSEYQRSNGVKLEFSVMIANWKPLIQICKSNMQGIWTVAIKYDKI